jgi:hypothetical protein
LGKGSEAEMSKLQMSIAMSQRETAERLRREDVKFSQYRLNVLRSAPEANRAIIEAVEKRIHDLQQAA